MATKKNTQKELEEFKKSLVGKSVKELQDIEQEIIKKAEETDKEIAATKFDLPDTGDNGTMLLSIIGIVTMAGAALVIVLATRKKSNPDRK